MSVPPLFDGHFHYTESRFLYCLRYQRHCRYTFGWFFGLPLGHGPWLVCVRGAVQIFGAAVPTA